MDDPKNPNQNPLDSVVPTTPITDVPSTSPPAPEPLSPVVSDPQQDVPPPPSDLPSQPESTPDESGLPAGEASLPPVIAPPPAKSKTKLFAAIAAVVLLLVSIPAGIILVRQQQELREQARVPTCECKGGFWTGEDCTVELGQPCSIIPPQCPDGSYWNGETCAPKTGDGGTVCTPGSFDRTCTGQRQTCDANAGVATIKQCKTDGSGWDDKDPECRTECAVTRTICTPGEFQRTCTGQRQTCDANAGVAEIKQCNAQGTAWENKDPECRTECAVGGGGDGKIPSEQDEGGCCDQGAAANSPKGCRTTGGFNEVCDIANGACQSGLSCRSLAGCAKDTDCGPGNKCVNSKCESGGGGSPAPSQAPTPTPTPTPAAGTCGATIASLPDFITPNQSVPVTVKLDSSTAGCEYVALRTDGKHEPSLKTVSGACVGATYGATINSGLAGQHKLEFAVNDTQPYPGAPSRNKTVCSTKTFETIDLITAPDAYCSNIAVLRGGAPITDLSQIQVGDHLNLQATCVTTSANLSFDKIRFRITAPSGAKPDQDQTATKDITARIHQVSEQPNIYKATGILTIDRIGSYNIKVWGHTKEDNKWKGKK